MNPQGFSPIALPQFVLRKVLLPHHGHYAMGLHPEVKKNHKEHNSKPEIMRTFLRHYTNVWIRPGIESSSGQVDTFANLLAEPLQLLQHTEPCFFYLTTYNKRVKTWIAYMTENTLNHLWCDLWPCPACCVVAENWHTQCDIFATPLLGDGLWSVVHLSKSTPEEDNVHKLSSITVKCEDKHSWKFVAWPRQRCSFATHSVQFALQRSCGLQSPPRLTPLCVTGNGLPSSQLHQLQLHVGDLPTIQTHDMKTWHMLRVSLQYQQYQDDRVEWKGRNLFF